MFYIFNNYKIDPDNFTIEKNGGTIGVEPRVFDLIIYLIENKSKVVTREELFEVVWKGRDVLDATLSNHIKKARSVLGDNGQSQTIIKTVHGRGYQFVATFNNSSKLGTVENKVNRYDFNWFFKNIYLVIVTIAILLSISIFTIRSNNNTLKKIAVLPFLNIKPDKETDYFGFAIADQIIGEIAYMNNLIVRPSNSIWKYSQNKANMSTVGKELRVDYVLSGNYLKIGNNIRLNIEIVATKNNELIWHSNKLEVSYENLFKLQDIITQKVVTALNIEFAQSEINLVNKDISQSPLAYEYYIRSIALPDTTQDNGLAIKLLEKSVELDPNFAPTHIQLGRRIHNLEVFGFLDSGHSKDSIAYYLQALKLNPSSMDALSFLASAYTETNQIDKAMESIKKLQQINPNSPFTHYTLGYTYHYAGYVEGAIKEMEIAINLDPQNVKYRKLINIYAGAKLHDKAVALLKTYPESVFTLSWNALLNYSIGNIDLSLDYFNRVLTEDKAGLWAQVAIAYKARISGDIQKGLSAAKLLDSKTKDGEMTFVSAYYNCMFEEKSMCLDKLEKSIDEGFFNIVFLDTHTFFDIVRNDPRFIQLYNRANVKHLAFMEKYINNQQ